MLPLVFPVLLFAGVLIATITDLRTREVPDTVSYGLIAIGVLGGLVVALARQDLWFFLERIFGLLVGLVIGAIAYYTRQWGGGDAKLIIGIGAIVGVSRTNLSLIAFLALLVLCGALYGLFALLWLALVTHRKRFLPAFKTYLREPGPHRLRIALVVVGVVIVVGVFFAPPDVQLLLMGLLCALYLLMYSYLFSRVVERTVLLKEYSVGKLTEGDWIAKDVVVRGKTLVSHKTTGITLDDIARLKKANVKTVTVKEGIAFVPAFLLALVVLYALVLWRGEAWVTSAILAAF
jgi:Flp pilus assembly protein protease CpaA